MFTGIIQALGHVERIEQRHGDMRLTIHSAELKLTTAQVGDSIAVNGVCLTATALTPPSFTADVSRETLTLTTLGTLTTAAPVNVETALTLATPLGGHLVSGHVDGIGYISRLRQDGRSLRLHLTVPAALARYIAHKGAICIDGVSLTVNEINGNEVALNIVPHTQQHTIINTYRIGTQVNIEVDLVARYLERLLFGQHVDCAHVTPHLASHATAHASAVTQELLTKHGFTK